MTVKDVVIVGAGLSGLTAAWQLHRHSIDVLLVEARTRLGGRVLTREIAGGCFDLGPSWVWPDQPYVTGVVQHLDIPLYSQFTGGDLLHQSVDGQVRRDSINRPMADALRLKGGVAAIASALASELPADNVATNTALTGISIEPGTGTAVGNEPNRLAKLSTTTNGESSAIYARQVALAIPLRLAAGVQYDPPLHQASLQCLQSTPTWMAGHAKYLAVFENPFWREQGLSGSALSRHGPLAEVHDASMQGDRPFALFGFMGVDGPTRDRLTKARLIDKATRQLVDLFGCSAASPKHVELMDWSNEPYTAAHDDRRSPDHHPQYGVRIPLQHPWSEVLDFIVSETSSANGGLVEGAIHRGCEFASHVLRQRQIAETSVAQETNGVPHTASMSWGWIPDRQQ